jgi:putative ATPase
MSQRDLFSDPTASSLNEAHPASPPPPQPLAARMRPQLLAEFVGQSHLLAEGKLLRRAIESQRIQSMIFFGPPGTGKTSLARLIAKHCSNHFERLSGVESSVSDIRQVLAKASNRLANQAQPTLLFVDEIHRFNKAQQDVLLPDVESGTVRLIGATTENPFFFVNAPLVSRSQVFQLQPLAENELLTLLQRALTNTERGLGQLPLKANPEALSHLAKLADGDARKALNSLEIAALTTPPSPQDNLIHLTLEVAEECIQKKAVVYGADGDAHYDTISAFIKSMRGSDPDATLYWLAKMIHAGEDPRFIARRIVIHAAEDVGLADPTALILATSAFQAAEFIGWPEARIPIAQAALYIATAPKSNSVVKAIDAALDEVGKNPTQPVPNHLRDAHYAGAKQLQHGKDYIYPHDLPGHFAVQSYMPSQLSFYTPSDQGREARIRERLQQWLLRTHQEKQQP